MKPFTRNVLMGYGAFCAVNWAATYFAARSGSPMLFGSPQLLSLNESLRPLNVLAYIVNPIDFAQRVGAAPAGAAAPAGGQQFLPGTQTLSRAASGDTTTFGP